MSTGQITLPGMNPMATHPTTEPSNLEFAETQSVTLCWEISGLKDIFEKSRGESKSKCIKSAVFGDPDNLWEVIFYPNSGSPNTSLTNPPPAAPNSGIGEYSSFYLSAVPTDEEKAHGIKGKWTRKGLYAFRFEVKTKGGPAITAKEAANHVFSSKTVNWGWQSFARRDTLFYGAPTVRANDSFTVTCTVSSGACPPAGTWLNLYGNLPSTASTPANAFTSTGAGWKGSDGGWKGLGGGNGAMAGARKLVPKSVVNSFGSLFDDETYSDVEFWLPTRRRRGRKAHARVGSERQELSREMASHVKEQEFATTNTTTTTVVHSTSPVVTNGTSLTTSLSNDAEMLSIASPSNTSEPIPTEQAMVIEQPEVSTPRAPSADPYYRKIWANKKILRRGEFFSDLLFGGFAEGNDPPSRPESPGPDSDLFGWDDSDIDEEMQTDSEDEDTPRRPFARPPSENGPRKTKIVIRDAAYYTWQALIYYLYTDDITFAPLASSFIPEGAHSTDRPISATSASFRQFQPALTATSAVNDSGAAGRRAWIKAWVAERLANGDWPTNAPRPVSAKAIFRLADKLDLPSLRQRAFQHIISQLTIHNIPYEVFSQFSATYEEVRKVETSFFLQHWNEIRSSPAMRHIWSHIRSGKHQGFEEVWPYIVANLEFVPVKPAVESEEGSGGTGMHFIGDY